MALPAKLETRLHTARSRRVIYPTSDGKPMAETDKHRDPAVYVIEALKARYVSQPNVYVSGNNFVFWEEGEPGKRISPDAYVVFGVRMRQRDSYRAWEEGGHLPDVVFEFTSRKTRQEDTDFKRPRYERELRVPEYFLFDPTGDYLNPGLQGYRLVGGRYVPMELVDGRLYSEKLGLELVMEGERLRLHDPATDEWLLDHVEQVDKTQWEASRARQAELRAEEEALARRALEEQNRMLLEQIEALNRRSSQE